MKNYIQDIKQILAQARQKAYAAVNSAMVEAYWQIGKRIVEEEQDGKERADYGEAILKELSIELSTEFGKGFSYANLYNMRQFYLTYRESEIFYTLCRELTWSHNRLIMRIDSPKVRNYYLTEAISQNWSVRTLQRNIKSQYYQRIIGNKSNDNIERKNITQDFIKDPYVLEFLKLPEIQYSENDLESSIINHLQQFLMELGKGFSFVGRQYRVSTETEHFFIDLVFYNYILKCFILFDLKIGGLTHQDIGQMDMYRRMFDDLKRPEGDNPTIGVILCAEKSDTIVKYSVMNDHPQLFASKYIDYLPTEEELVREIEQQKLFYEQRHGKK